MRILRVMSEGPHSSAPVYTFLFGEVGKQDIRSVRLVDDEMATDYGILRLEERHRKEGFSKVYVTRGIPPDCELMGVWERDEDGEMTWRGYE